MSALKTSFGLGFARSSCSVGFADKYRILPIRLPSMDYSKSLNRTCPLRSGQRHMKKETSPIIPNEN